jgi:hypothetical protein
MIFVTAEAGIPKIKELISTHEPATAAPLTPANPKLWR